MTLRAFIGSCFTHRVPSLERISVTSVLSINDNSALIFVELTCVRFSCGHLSLGAVADSDTEQVFKLEGEIAEFPRARASPIPQRKWEPIDPSDASKFGYDVTVRPFVRRNFGGGGRGKGVSSQPY